MACDITKLNIPSNLYTVMLKQPIDPEKIADKDLKAKAIRADYNENPNGLNGHVDTVAEGLNFLCRVDAPNFNFASTDAAAVEKALRTALQLDGPATTAAPAAATSTAPATDQPVKSNYHFSPLSIDYGTWAWSSNASLEVSRIETGDSPSVSFFGPVLPHSGAGFNIVGGFSPKTEASKVIRLAIEKGVDGEEGIIPPFIVKFGDADVTGTVDVSKMADPTKSGADITKTATGYQVTIKLKQAVISRMTDQTKIQIMFEVPEKTGAKPTLINMLVGNVELGNIDPGK